MIIPESISKHHPGKITMWMDWFRPEINFVDISPLPMAHDVELIRTLVEYGFVTANVSLPEQITGQLIADQRSAFTLTPSGKELYEELQTQLPRVHGSDLQDL